MQKISWERLIEDKKDKEHNSINFVLEQVPTYIRSYEKFYKFIKAINNYIMFTGTNKIEQVHNYLTIKTAKSDTLNKIANKLDVSVVEADKYSNLVVNVLSTPENTYIKNGFELIDSIGNIWVFYSEEDVLLEKDKTLLFHSKENMNIYLDSNNNGTGNLTYNKDLYFPNNVDYPEFINFNSSTNSYEEILKVAIKGAAVKRASNSGRQNLKETLEGIFEEIERVDIYDKGLTNEEEKMSSEIVIYGNIESYTSELIEKYLLPNITGVSWTVIYIPYGKNLFGFDKNEFIETSEIAKERGYGITGWDTGEFAPIKILT